MGRLKIEDLAKDMKIKEEDLRKVMGGGSGRIQKNNGNTNISKNGEYGITIYVPYIGN